MKKIISITICLLLIITLLVSCTTKRNENTVIIYSSMVDYENEELAKQLKDKFPNINVVIQYYSTGNNAAKIKAEGINTEADIILALETASTVQIADYLANLNGFKQEHYLENINDNDSRYLTWEKYEGAIVVNTEVLKEKNLSEPNSYEDLLKPEYKNLIAMSNPKTSGTGYMFLNTWVATMGVDNAFGYIDKLQENIKQFTESGSGPVKMLIQGEVAVGLGMVFQAAKQITEGSPLKIILFEEGCPYNTSSFGIIKGRENNENVKEIFNFLNEDFIYYNAEYVSPGEVLVNQKITMENYPNNIKSAKMESIADDKFKQELLAKWKY